MLLYLKIKIVENFRPQNNGSNLVTLNISDRIQAPTCWVYLLHVWHFTTTVDTAGFTIFLAEQTEFVMLRFYAIKLMICQNILMSYLNFNISNTSTYGNFILMNTLHTKNDIKTAENPRAKSSILFNLGVDGLFVCSRTTNPRPPRVKRKLEAKPSMIYCPFTLYGMKATWNI